MAPLIILPVITAFWMVGLFPRLYYLIVATVLRGIDLVSNVMFWYYKKSRKTLDTIFKQEQELPRWCERAPPA